MIPLIQQLLIVIALLSAISNQGKAVNEATDTVPGQSNDYDVVVIGGTPAGIAAAIAAGRAGKTVIVIEQSPVLGGVLSSGVIRLDDRYVESNCNVIEESKGDRITGVVTQERNNQGKLGKKHTYPGKVIIDATYEADLVAFAKVPFRIGREARSNEEPHAGRIYTNYFRSVPGKLNATILPNSTGKANQGSQAFTYRLTGKDYGRADHPYRLKQPPPNYDPAKYRWNRNKKPIIPNRKFDLLGISWAELVKQGCVLFFYTDLPGDAPGFEAVQKLSLLGAVTDNELHRLRANGPATSLTDLNTEAYRFRPNEPVTMGEFARMVVKGFQIPLSITAAHFSDVPRGHPAFKYVETLYDYST